MSRLPLTLSPSTSSSLSSSLRSSPSKRLSLRTSPSSSPSSSSSLSSPPSFRFQAQRRFYSPNSGNGAKRPGPNGLHASSSAGSSTATASSGSATATLGSAGGVGAGAAGAGAGAAAGSAGKGKSGHIVWYREIVPAMMPVIGIGTAIFFALQLIQTHLSHSRSLVDAQTRITALESELAHLQSVQRRQAASWGDSLGRVVRVVQRSVSVPAGAVEEVEAEGEKILNAAGKVAGMGEGQVGDLVERVRAEFADVKGEGEGKTRGWRRWVGLA